jgi:5-methylcytosine-specific restriction endonuclease McrA
MLASVKVRKAKKCRVAACGALFVPMRLGQAVCSPACAIKDAPANRDKAHKALADVGRREIKVRKEKLKSRGDHLADTQKAFNAWIRERDMGLPCVSCGRHHDGQWQAGHFKSVGGHPALRYEPLNVWRQCAPCNTHKSGDLLNYRVELVRRIGEDKVLWLEGPHAPKKYTVEELKAMTADYRARVRDLKTAANQ